MKTHSLFNLLEIPFLGTIQKLKGKKNQLFVQYWFCLVESFTDRKPNKISMIWFEQNFWSEKLDVAQKCKYLRLLRGADWLKSIPWNKDIVLLPPALPGF